MNAAPDTSMTMIQRAKLGDDDAWGRLVDIYGPLVHLQCRRKRLQPSDAKDVTPEVFISVFGALDRFEKHKASDRFLSFLRTIASRRIADFYPQESKRPDKARGGDSDWFVKLNLPADGDLTDAQSAAVWSPEDLLTSLEAQIWKQAKKKYGTNKTFRAFELEELQGMPTAEVAAELNIAPAKVRTYSSRVKTWIRKQMAELPSHVVPP